jgi:hypothetical protein
MAPIAERQTLGIVCRDEPCPAVARPGEARRGPRAARLRLRWSTEGFGTLVLQEAKTLLGQLA